MGREFFSTPPRPDRLRCPPKLPSSGHRESFSLGIKLSGSEANHLPPSSAEVKNAWRYNSIAPYVFMALYVIKHRDKFTSHCTDLGREATQP
jgi:hypothetical protein